MPQTATRPVTRRTLKTIPKTETSEQRNIRLYGCPLDHTPNAETIKAFNEPAIGPFATLEEFFSDLYADDDCSSKHAPNTALAGAIEIVNALRDGKLPDRPYNSIEEIMAYLHA